MEARAPSCVTSGTNTASKVPVWHPLGKARLPMLLPLQQPPDCPSLGTEGSVLGSSPPLLSARVQEGLCGQPDVSAVAPQRFLIPRLAAASVAWAGISQHEPFLPHVRATVEGRIMCQPPQLVQINQHCTDVRAGSAMGCASNKGTF